MYPISSRTHSWTQRLALVTIGSLLFLTSAPADSPKNNGVGTVLQIPLLSLGYFMAQNIAHQNNVSLLHVSQTAVGDLNSQVATVSVRQYSRYGKKLEPAKRIWLPTDSLGYVRATNRDTTFITQDVYGSGNMQVAQVAVQQSNSSADEPVKTGTRYLLAPLSGLSQLLALNPKNINVVRINQLAVGDANSQVALVSVSQENVDNVKVPKSMTSPLVALNLNLTIINQTAVGNNNTQVVTIDVGQDNNLNPPED